MFIGCISNKVFNVGIESMFRTCNFQGLFSDEWIEKTMKCFRSGFNMIQKDRDNLSIPVFIFIHVKYRSLKFFAGFYWR